MTSKSSTKENMQRLALIGAPILCILFILFVDLDPGHPQVTRTAAVGLLMAIWWITEALPLAATALLPVVLFPTLGIMSGKNVASEYVNHIIFLFIGGFLVALAMERWNLHRRIALKIMLWVGTHPRGILLGFIIATWFLSMWISNTATSMMMVPVALAVVSRFESTPEDKQNQYALALFLAIAYSASIGGIATLVGTPPNLAFVRIFAIAFPAAPEVTFSQWFVFAFPLSLALLVVLWFVLSTRYVPRSGGLKLDRSVIKNQYAELGPMSFEEKVVLTDFIMLVLLWLSREGIIVGDLSIPGWSKLFPNSSFVDDGTVAIGMALLLFLIPAKREGGTRIMDWQIAHKIPWGIILLIGGGFALGEGFEKSGLSLWLGSQLNVLGFLPPLLVVASICLVVTFLTELTSNTATAQIFLPIIASFAVGLHINPLLLMIPATVSASCAFMLPIATPPNAIVFGTGRITIHEMVRVGLILNFAGIGLITIAVYTLGQWVFGIDLSHFPFWALSTK